VADLCGVCGREVPIDIAQIVRIENDEAISVYHLECEYAASQLNPCEYCGYHRQVCIDCGEPERSDL
jgi:hypothetical protein